MLIDYFYTLRAAQVPVSVKEYLMLLQALAQGVIGPERGESSGMEDFYHLSRATLVKDERHYDKFDRAFAAYFKGVTQVADFSRDIPAQWLRQAMQRLLSDEQKNNAPKVDWDDLLRTLQERLQEQKGRHEGGSKWIGTGGTSPFGNGGYNPEGIRIGGEGAGQRKAVKVWDRREFANLDDAVELGTRNIKVALRRLRRFARRGAAEEFDLDGTVEATARNAGLLDIKMVPERRNAVKVLLFLDVGGSMDDHVRLCEELFSAARSEFRHLEYFYFHNFLYESVWKDNRRRHAERIPTLEILRTYASDYRVVMVGDAAMSPYEILQPGGSIEHWNEEPGAAWLQRLLQAYPRFAWLNPDPEERWGWTQSIQITRELTGERMFPMTLEGLDRAIRALG